MADLSRVPHSRDLFHVRLVLAKKADQLRCRPVREAKNDSVVDLVLSGVSSNPPKNREATCCQALHRRQISVFKIRPDTFSCRRKVSHVSLHVALNSEGQVNERFSSSDSVPMIAQSH